ncbi:MAG: diguanylate cyclase (GGDEF)-like protein/PAS domain S-box-containing protein [Yoonia sp.]|jgi:diguanylate cyclase (GGDEF)-like protein/PAS domain S-box-containing protein
MILPNNIDNDVNEHLNVALNSMDQGLMVVRADLTVAIFNVRAAELADCPRSFADTRPTFHEILAYQVETGAISQAYMDSSINDFILHGDTLVETHMYTRETASGRWLDVRTRPLPDGGFVRTFTDQTERHAISLAKQQSDGAYRALFENAAVGIYRASADGQLLRVNPALLALHGYHSEDDILRVGKNFAAEVHVDANHLASYGALLQNEGLVTDFESEIYRHLTRERIWISESTWLILDQDGETIGYEGTVVEITERKRLEALIKHAADHDAMTGLPNRARFNQVFNENLGGETPFHLAYLDLDGFKIVNDTYGHLLGDDLLTAAALRFTNVMSVEEPVFRMGGDEFAIILYENDPTFVRKALERIIDTLMQPFQLGDTAVEIGVSIGVTKSVANSTASEILHWADIGMYRAKDIKGSAIVFQEPETG